MPTGTANRHRTLHHARFIRFIGRADEGLHLRRAIIREVNIQLQALAFVPIGGSVIGEAKTVLDPAFSFFAIRITEDGFSRTLKDRFLCALGNIQPRPILEVRAAQHLPGRKERRRLRFFLMRRRAGVQRDGD